MEKYYGTKVGTMGCISTIALLMKGIDYDMLPPMWRANNWRNM